MLDELDLQRVKAISALVYEAACNEADCSMGGLKSMYDQGRIDEKQYEKQRNKLDEVYREKICKLQSSVLDNMLAAHKSGQRKIAEKTIHSISLELLERELNKGLK